MSPPYRDRLVIEVDFEAPHNWYGPLTDACDAINGLHICMRGARTDGRPEPGPHRCACGHHWITPEVTA